MDKKCLAVVEPPVNTYPRHAYLLSAIMQFEEAKSWFYGNYIQLFAVKNEEKYDLKLDYFFDFFTPDLERSQTPWVIPQRMTREMIFKMNRGIVELLIDAIDLNFYTLLPLNEYYIPHSGSYKQFQFPHPIMVYGYDRTEQHFQIGGYFEQKFSLKTVSFEAVIEAFSNMEILSQWMNEVFLYSIGISEVHCRMEEHTLDLVSLTEMLEDYLYSKNTSERYRIYLNPQEGQYGLAVYSVYKQYLQKLLEGTNDYDIRPFHLLYEHKKIMKERICYLEKGLYIDSSLRISDRYEDIITRAYKIRGNAIKFNLTHNEKVIHSMIEAIDLLMNEEQNILRDLLNAIEASK